MQISWEFDIQRAIIFKGSLLWYRSKGATSNIKFSAEYPIKKNRHEFEFPQKATTYFFELRNKFGFFGEILKQADQFADHFDPKSGEVSDYKSRNVHFQDNDKNVHEDSAGNNRSQIDRRKNWFELQTGQNSLK